MKAQRRPRYGLTCFILSLVLGPVLFLSACGRKTAETTQTQAPPPPPVPVSTVPVVERRIQRSIDVIGTLMADEEATISSEVAGTIAEMNVDLGSRVQRGQVIARLDAREFDLRVQQARSSVEQARARLGLSGDQYAIDPGQTAEVKQAKAALDDARLKYDRAKQLIANGDISQQRFDEAEVNRRSADARHQAAVESVRNQLALIQQRRAELAIAEKVRNDSVIRASLSGAVSQKLVSRGEYVAVRSPIVTVVKMSPLKLRADLPEMYAPETRTGQEVIVSVDALPGRTFQGRVARISPSLNEKTRSMTIEALLDNQEGLLKPGLFAHVKLQSRQATPALMIPAKAVITFAGITKAYAIEGDRAAERRLRLGAREGDMVEVIEGLKVGEPIALDNLERLASGTPVSVQDRPRPGA